MAEAGVSFAVLAPTAFRFRVSAAWLITRAR
jgi:hypothetical protein